ncbi:MAG: type IX secretion system membrane protein PorP/SprF [Bacteroidales bacterium]|nr:type IX secretion system membrane protein PorP/SprF [Bacteroidales bacterium]MBN2819012.1 type IX secretion system membrane protein PorP/SprF [Bacteroidales bacterium]
MRKIFLLHFAIIISTCLAYPQLFPLSDQYITNGLAINPAYAGSEDALSFYIGHRNQWTKLNINGAPKTNTAAIHSPLGNERIGLGLLIINDNIGNYSKTTILGNYAYIIEMGEGRMSLGIGIGVSVYSLNWQDLDMADEIDNLMQQAVNEKENSPNFSAGFYYHGKDYFYGFSIPLFFSNSSTSTGSLDFSNDIADYNYHAVGGYTFKLDSKLKLLPTALAKYYLNNGFQADIGAQLIYNDKISAGITYRSKNEISTLLQIAFTPQLKLTYNYDISTGIKFQTLGGSHEISLKFILDFRSRVIGPRFF